MLQDVAANVATPRGSSGEFKLTKTTFDSDGALVQELESWIDGYEQELPPLTNFILPVYALCISM